jgi:hypothetical protein
VQLNVGLVSIIVLIIIILFFIQIILASPCGVPNDSDIMMKVLQEITFIPLPANGH